MTSETYQTITAGELAAPGNLLGRARAAVVSRLGDASERRALARAAALAGPAEWDRMQGDFHRV